MKTFLLFSIAVFSFFLLPAQEQNQACYHDTALVEKLISKTDTEYMVREEFQKGDWALYYDFQLSLKRSEYHFDKNGQRTGVWKEWYRSGKTKSEWDYSKAWFSAFPPGKAYYPNGLVRTIRVAGTDSLIETSYFLSGKISQVRKWLKSGMQVLDEQWCENGQLIVSYNPTSTIPLPVKKYYCDGKLKAEYNWYVYGFTGAYTEYFEDGKTAVKGQFQDLPAGSTTFMARKTGEWTYYEETGKVKKTEHWEAGRLLKQ